MRLVRRWKNVGMSGRSKNYPQPGARTPQPAQVSIPAIILLESQSDVRAVRPPNVTGISDNLLPVKTFLCDKCNA